MDYRFVDNRVARDFDYSNIVKLSRERNLGLIEPEADPGIIGQPFLYTHEQIEQLNIGAKDREDFDEGLHLPKGFFSPEGQIFDTAKENLVISVTEDESLEPLLKGLDEYFRSGLSTVEAIKQKFNIFIAWSTSALDAVKSLKKIKDQIGDWAKAHILFLNDSCINIGTGPYFDGKKNGEGNFITSYAEDFLELPRRQAKVISQTSDRSGQHHMGNTWGWSPEDADAIISTLSEDLRKQQSHERLQVTKLRDALETNYNGVRIPIEAFVKSLES